MRGEGGGEGLPGSVDGLLDHFHVRLRGGVGPHRYRARIGR